jgi:hypothetical protein
MFCYVIGNMSSGNMSSGNMSSGNMSSGNSTIGNMVFGRKSRRRMVNKLIEIVGQKLQQQHLHTNENDTITF